MTELSKEGQGIMDHQSVFNIPESVRNLLVNTHQSYDSRRDVTGDIEQNHGAVEQNSDQQGQEAVSGLLVALAGPLAASVSPKGFLSLLTKCQSKPFDYEPYRELVQCVLQKAPLPEIAAHVERLISEFFPNTPPTSTVLLNSPFLPDTPRTASSASQQGFEQTEDLLKDRIFEEIKHCTWRGVGGFDKKYFEEKEWTPKSKDIYDQVSSRHVNGQWAGFPDPPVESQVFEWLDKFQKEFLPDAPGEYVRSTVPGELTGGEAQRQVDILLINKTNCIENGEQYNWKDIQVIGEHKRNRNFDFKPVHLQMSRYVRDAFIAQPTRRFVHGFTLCGTLMELWVYDRSGCFSSGRFDIHEQPQRFIGAIVGYAMMTDEELGLDTFIQRATDGRFVDIEEVTTRQKKRLELKTDPFVKRRAIVGRGTSCYCTNDLEHVVKFSWTPTARPLEVSYFQTAREKGVEGIATLIGHSSITSIAEMRKGLTITAAQLYRFREPRGTWSTPRSYSLHSGSKPHSERVPLGKRSLVNDEPQERKKSRSTTNIAKPTHELAKEQAEQTPYIRNDDPYDNRQLTCLAISPAGRALVKFEDVPELLTALRDAIKAHKSLYMKGGILHRDISETNIIITDPRKADGFAGMLIDLDLAKESEQQPSGVRQQTGTMEFMAIDVLEGNVRHTYSHDLESFFYVLLWMCARRAWEAGGQQPKSTLKRWYTGTFPEIASAKTTDMMVINERMGFRGILKEFHPDFESVKNLCEQIRSLLFTYDESKGGLLKNTPERAEELYDPIIKAFDQAITDAQHRKKVNSD